MSDHAPTVDILLRDAQALLAARNPSDIAGARRILARVAAADNATSAQLGHAGGILFTLSAPEDALLCYDRALLLEPSVATHWFNRGAVLRALGRIDAAEADYDRAIALKPTDYEAWLNRSQLRTQSRDRNHIAALEKILGTAPQHWAARVHLHYALAKEFEDVGEPARSFAQLATASQLRRANLAYDVDDDVSTMDAIIATFGADFVGQTDGDTCDAPIFVIGMPRSGTTLVERVIGSHPDVAAAGELNAFPQALMARAALEPGGKAKGKIGLVQASARFNMAALGAAYLQAAAPFVGTALFFVDKLPLNYLYIGLIARALPNSRIVHVTRHPMANCYGIFKTLFKQGYPFSYSFEDLATYYAAYRRLMAHWHAVLGDRLITISYEALVAAQEPESRRLIGRLGLGWDDACLAFHANPAPSTSHSATQVRQPMYATSVEQWRAVRDELAPLRKMLIARGIEPAEIDRRVGD